jgi:hypothetical protein
MKPLDLRPKRHPALTLIERANEEASIFDVMKDFCAIEVPEGGRSYKTFCPFQVEHPHALDKNFRVYPATNTAYCFEMHGLLRPVRIVQLQRDVKATKAAVSILERYGLMKPRKYGARFNEMLVEREQQIPELGEMSYIVEALHTSLRSHPAYDEVQYRASFQNALDEELGRLNQLVENRYDVSSVRSWFEAARDRLRAIVVAEGEPDE